MTISGASVNLCPMKPAVYLTSPKAMRKARLNQPRVTSAQARVQRELLRRAAEKFSATARSETLLVGRAKTAA